MDRGEDLKKKSLIIGGMLLMLLMIAMVFWGKKDLSTEEMRGLLDVIENYQGFS